MKPRSHSAPEPHHPPHAWSEPTGPPRRNAASSGSRGVLLVKFAPLLHVLIATLVLALSAVPDRSLAQESATAPSGDLPALKVVQPSDEDLLILELRLNRLILSAGLIAYRTGAGLCLYLGDVTRSLEFPIQVAPERGRAEGWFLREDRTFLLDFAAGTAAISGKAATYDPQRLELHADDICVEVSLLSAWFPVEFEFDETNAIVSMVSWEPLPVEQRLLREQARSALRRDQGTAGDLPRAEAPYRWIGWPAVDIFTELEVSQDTDSGDGARISSRYSALAVGDLLKMSGELLASGDDDDPLASLRMRLGRKDPEGRLLGSLGVTEFTLGDIVTPQTPLVAESEPGRGFEVSSYPLNQPDEFDRVSLRGDLLLGWEVELYRNGVLLDFQQSRDDGRYEFEDVPVLFGRNDFKLIFYGPQGQRREVLKEIFVGADLAKPGDKRFRLAVNQQDEDLVTVSSDDEDEEEEEGEVRVIGQYDIGIADGWSAGGAFYSLPLDDERQNYAGLNLRGSLEDIAGRLDVAADQDGGFAAGVSAQGLAGPINLSVRHDQFFDFASERSEESEDELLSSSSVVRADAIVPIGESLHLPISLSAEYDRLEEGGSELELSNRISTAYRRFTASNTLDYTWRFGGDFEDDQTADGSLLLNYYMRPFVLRGELNYELVPEADLQSALASLDWDLDEDTTALFGIEYDIDDSQVEFAASINRDFGFLTLGGAAEVSSEGDYLVGLTMNISLGRDPRSGTVQVTSDHLAREGALAARIFVDENVNGEFDDGDRLVEGAQVTSDRRAMDVKTGTDGTAIISELTVYEPADVRIDERSIDDPYLIPGSEGVSVMVRPGALVDHDFPLVRTGEIDGTVWLARPGGGVREIGDVVLELVNEAGEVVRTARSEFDGFYLFEFVPVGHYRIRVSPDQLARLSLTAPSEEEVVLAGEEAIISGVDFTVTPAPKETSGDTATAPEAEHPLSEQQGASLQP